MKTSLLKTNWKCGLNLGTAFIRLYLQKNIKEEPDRLNRHRNF